MTPVKFIAFPCLLALSAWSCDVEEHDLSREDAADTDDAERGSPDAQAAAKADGASCEGFCGDRSASSCWCDSSCESYGDCCADYRPVCLGDDPDATAIAFYADGFLSTEVFVPGGGWVGDDVIFASPENTAQVHAFERELDGTWVDQGPILDREATVATRTPDGELVLALGRTVFGDGQSVELPFGCHEVVRLTPDDLGGRVVASCTVAASASRFGTRNWVVDLRGALGWAVASELRGDSTGSNAPIARLHDFQKSTSVQATHRFIASLPVWGSVYVEDLRDPYHPVRLGSWIAEYRVAGAAIHDGVVYYVTEASHGASRGILYAHDAQTGVRLAELSISQIGDFKGLTFHDGRVFVASARELIEVEVDGPDLTHIQTAPVVGSLQLQNIEQLTIGGDRLNISSYSMLPGNRGGLRITSFSRD